MKPFLWLGWWRRFNFHRLHDSFYLNLLKELRRWERRLRVRGQVQTQDKGVCVPAPKVQEISVFIDPPNRQSL